jgi:hypothetical protein
MSVLNNSRVSCELRGDQLTLDRRLRSGVEEPRLNGGHCS